ncbi:acyl carrier protein [Streptomyces halstedii]|uniref:Acyl carrier protein n=1 Tax=Streptomyces halstedii TaxID=1944 RepID=A0ABS6TXG0_STRHA|nr:acyl carrier protein [Streptomyces halstedii]MBV7672779.1 acyl carrier protein [Streptomyces halstedii]
MIGVPPAAARTDVSLTRQRAALPEADRDGVILREVRNVAAAVLGHRSGEVSDPHALFPGLGFGSLGAVESVSISSNWPLWSRHWSRASIT